MTNNKVRHIFVVNPVAGKGVEAGPLEAKIRDACEVSGAEYEIYITCARWVRWILFVGGLIRAPLRTRR